MTDGRTLETDLFNLPIKKRRKGANGKVKGNTNERECAKSMGYWVKRSFVRVPGSGGLRWKDSDKITGDITCDDPDFNFVFTVETKYLADIAIHRYMDDDKRVKKIYKIWEQALTDGKRSGKLPMCMLRFNRLGFFDRDNIRYRDYYLVLDREFGGNLLQLFVPVALGGYSEKLGCHLVGFLFSDVVTRIPFDRFNLAIEKGNFVNKFKTKHNHGSN